MINLLDIQPNVVSTDIGSYTTLLYSVPKWGKTTMMYKLFGQRALFLGFEQGQKALAGIMATPVKDYSTLRQIMMQLKNAEVKKKFDVVVFDTVSLFDKMIEKHVCDTNGVNNIGDIPHGKGYGMVERTITQTIMEIQALGYGVVYICHATTSEVVDPITNIKSEVPKTIPDLSKRCRKVLLGDCDFILYGTQITNPESGIIERVLVTQGTPSIEAGGRVPINKPYIPYGAEHFQKAVEETVTMMGEGNITSEKKENAFIETEKQDFKTIMDRLMLLGQTLGTKGLGAKVQEIVAKEYGRDEQGNVKLITQATEGQIQVVKVVLAELEEVAKNNGVEI